MDNSHRCLIIFKFKILTNIPMYQNYLSLDFPDFVATTWFNLAQHYIFIIDWLLCRDYFLDFVCVLSLPQQYVFWLIDAFIGKVGNGRLLLDFPDFVATTWFNLAQQYIFIIDCLIVRPYLGNTFSWLCMFSMVASTIYWLIHRKCSETDACFLISQILWRQPG